MRLRSLLKGRSKRVSRRRDQNRSGVLRKRLLRHETLEDRRLLAVYTNPTDVPIPDMGTTTSEISVSDTDVIQDLNVQLTIEHTKAEDLDVFLIAPDSTRVELFTDVGGRSDNFIDTTLDDEASTSITSASAPFTGTFRPEGDLSAVEGTSLAGTWTLEITDDKRRETGVLKEWLMIVQPVGTPQGDFIDTNPMMLGNAGSNSGESNYFGKEIVIADNGDAMAVWQESEGANDFGPWRAMASTYEAATDTWNEPVVISDATVSYDIVNWLNLAGDGQGNYVATWQQGGSSYSDVWVNRYEAGVGWQTPFVLGTGTTYAYDPEVAMAYNPSTASSHAVVVWGYDDNLLISRLTDFAANTWSAPDIAGDVSDRINPTSGYVDMANDGSFMIVFTTYDTYDLYYSHYDWASSGWTEQNVLLETGAEWVSTHGIAMNRSGNAMVSWMQRTGEGDTYELWARRWNGNAWDGAPEIVADTSLADSSIRTPQVAIAENGESVVLWRQVRDGGTFRGAYVRHHDGTQWAAIGGVPDIVKLDTEDLGDVGNGAGNDAYAPNMEIEMDDVGNAVASWDQSDGTYVNLWAARFDRANSTWATAEKIEDAPLDASRPVVGMNGSGTAQVLWSQSDGGLNHVYAAIIPEPGNLPPTAVDDSDMTDEDASTLILKADLISNDTDPENDPLTITGFGTPGDGTLTDNGTSVTYTPNPDFSGTDTFTYTISDGNGGFDTGTVTVDVTPVNDAPFAVDDAVSTTEGTPVSGNVLTNDTDADGDTLTATLATAPTGGSIQLNLDGSFTYTPNTGTTSDTFEYMISDGNGGTDIGEVSIMVSSGRTDVVYVLDITVESKANRGRDWRAVFHIRTDSDGDGVAEETDDVAVGANITVTFAGNTYSGTTDSNGIFTTGWIKNLSGDQWAEVVDLTFADYFWNKALGEDDSDDEDDLPDELFHL